MLLVLIIRSTVSVESMQERSDHRSSVADPGPGSGAFLNPDTGSGIGFFRIPDPKPIFLSV
jgi:hypothetical protein